MKDKKKFSVILTMAAALLFLVCGCENSAVSYSAAGEAYGEELSAKSVSSDSESADNGGDSSLEEQKTENDRSSGQESGQIQVYVCGAVADPGVYTLAQGSRVYEAVAMAGGLLGTADEKALNQARQLSDGEQVTVLTKEETRNGATAQQGQDPAAQNADTVPEQKVNINTADENTLMTIPGIGESRAQAILDYRKENGKFETIEDIMKIEGIKEKMFEKIKDSITV